VSEDKTATVQAEFQQLTGALAVLVKLREEFGGWTEQHSEARDEETLDRVLDHIQSLEAAYKSRKMLLQEKLQSR
jgi:hypothetical protein